ncbi:transmembrane 4 L6 family member 19 isoform X2 [Aquila chrysaetos chrysaetos]|uniref:transmembrane 4 L6 family member 19 isoform X2 n=1 Tax=Aquila chrysaetos chrysaetos TaxID=223781 RepID=UPI001176A88D|nr:transmembrane 4 L6 family member 19 isoform X2 [Aquila chrysaetos chrysaetos]
MPPGQGSSEGWMLLAPRGITSRVAMCVGKCSRIVGPCLLALGMLSVAANILLLFPGGTSKYLVEGHISKQAKVMPGVWGGGITVLLAATHITAVGWQCAGCSDCGTRRNAFISAVLSKLALLGAAACFVLSGVGLTDGPLCFYNASEHGRGHGILWDYPFLDAGGKEPDTRAQNYLYDRHTWSTCLEPEGIVAWNVVLFSLLLLVSATEMVLASLQILNGCLGCLCGFCEGK